MKPLIGISCDTIHNHGRNDKYGQSMAYSDAIIEAGGTPLLIPITERRDAARDTGIHLDGLLLAGGNDVHPRFYGQDIRGARDIDLLRDEHELHLLDIAYERKLPILAICRGMQLLNVHRGGTLIQDIATERPAAMNHNGYKLEPGQQRLLHDVYLDPDSKLSKIIGRKIVSITANSFHHQAIDELGGGLREVGWTDDDIIEAVEGVSSDHYVLGVQAHPESLIGDIEPRWLRLFQSFVKAAKN